MRKAGRELAKKNIKGKKKLNDDECYEENSKLDKVGSDFSSSGQRMFPREGVIGVVT